MPDPQTALADEAVALAQAARQAADVVAATADDLRRLQAERQRLALQMLQNAPGADLALVECEAALGTATRQHELARLAQAEADAERQATERAHALAVLDAHLTAYHQADRHIAALAEELKARRAEQRTRRASIRRQMLLRCPNLPADWP
jgi:hypothetical protein